MQLREVNLKSQLKDRTMLEKQAEEMKAEAATASQNIKVKVRSAYTHLWLSPTPLPPGRRR